MSAGTADHTTTCTGHTDVCAVEQVPQESGVTALVDGTPVAVFRTHDDRWFALGNYDPFSRASVLARGILGTRGGRDVVASPMHKQHFDLATGECLEDETVRVPTYDVTTDRGRVLVGRGSG